MEFRARLFGVRLGTGDLAELERELSDASKQSPYNLDTQLRLLEVLAAAGKLSEVKELHAQYERQLANYPDAGAQGREAAAASEAEMLYLTQDYAGLFALAERPELADRAAGLRYQCHLETGQCGAAAADLQAGRGAPDGFDLLRLSVCADVGRCATGGQVARRGLLRVRSGSARATADYQPAQAGR